jgi:hypothetical protein
MGDSTDDSGPNWSQMLLTGVSAAIDSQIATPYQLNNPTYNTQYGTGGQSQSPYTAATAAAAKSSSSTMLLLIVGAVLLVVLLKK